MSRTFHQPKEIKNEGLKMPESQRKILEQVRNKAAELRKQKKNKVVDDRSH
jgi:Zn-dependent oligopeptidase